MIHALTAEHTIRTAKSYFDSELIATVFDLLYATSDIKLSINAALKYVGNRMNVNRCYIYETFDGGNTYNNTFEWSSPDIRTSIDQVYRLPKLLLSDLFACANQDGIFNSNGPTTLNSENINSLMKDANTYSFLHAQSKIDDFVKLFIGIDDCKNPRIWKVKEINSIIYVIKIISIFL